MKKFISPVLINLIKVATLLFVFVVLLHSSGEDENKGAESKVLFGVSDTVRVSALEALQVDEPVETETKGAHYYVLPAIAIGSMRLRL